MSKLTETIARNLRPNRPFHLPPPAQPVRARVKLTLEGVAQQPVIVFTDVRRNLTWRVAMEPDGDMRWKAKVRLPMEITIVEYYFEVEEQAIYELRQAEGENKPIYGEWTEKPYKIAIYDPKRMPSEWTRGMLIYQIFPDRFARGNTDRELTHSGVYGHEAIFMDWNDTPEAPPLGRDFFGGDLRGIIDKLDYLIDLGVECIYFTPIFEAATNHRYEAIDFMKIDPMLGDDDDFDELIRETRKRGMKVILDAVFNHCSSDSIYFDITGKHEQKDGIVGASQSKDSPYFRWFNFTKFPNEYDGWRGFGFMPEFVESPEMEEYFVGDTNSVTAYWLDRGIDGWRCDVADDNTDEFWRRFRKNVDETKPGAYLIAEEWRDATRYMLGDMYSGTMNYRFAWAVRGFLGTDAISPSELDDRLQTWIRDTPAPALHSQMNLLDSHDTDRIMTVCSGDVRRVKQLLAFQLAYVGSPCVYYGSETGLEGHYAEDGRRTIPWDGLNTDLHTFYKLAINLRNANMAMRLGDVTTVLADDQQRIYGFVRRYHDEAVYCVFNGSDHDVTVAVPLLNGNAGTFHDMLGLNADVEAENDVLNVTLGARSMAWYQMA